MKKQYYQPEVEVLLVQGNKTLLQGTGGGIVPGTDTDPSDPFGGAPWRY